MANDLLAFIHARLDEDEAIAKTARTVPDSYDHWTSPASGVVQIHGDDLDGLLATGDRRTADHIARWDPTRVLADVAAKRIMLGIIERVFNLHGLIQANEGLATPTCPENPRCACDRCLLTRALLMPYADHPDHNPAWAPTGI